MFNIIVQDVAHIYHLPMKKILFNLFNRTFGVIFRGIQLTLINRTPPTDFQYQINHIVPQGLHHYVNQRAVQESAEYVVNNFSTALIFNKREELWDYCLNRVQNLKTAGGIIVEFGVWKGESINFFARKCPNARVYGFDSFEGLEEDWYGYNLSKGSFSTNGELPMCEKNVELIKGWFEETVPSFIDKLQQSQIQILHMDADTYKPTTFVLNSLSNNLRRGTIVIFDEYFGYPNFQLHEFKAWQEFVISVGLKYKYIGYTELQVAVEIL